MKRIMPRRAANDTTKLPAHRAADPRRTPGGRTGLKQIADDLQLGVSTVSHAIKGDGTIAEATRRRVREYAASVGYTANAHAKKMRSTSTRVIGLVIPDVVLTYNEFVQHAFRRVAATGRELQIILSEFEPRLEDQALRTLLEQRVDGILLKSTYRHWDQVPHDHGLRTLIASGTPTVIVGDELRASGLPCCRTPTETYGRLLAEHAIDQGRRRIDWLLPVDLSKTPLEHLPQHRRAIQAAEQVGRERVGDRFRVRLRTLDELATDAGPVSSFADYGNYINEGLPERGVWTGRQMAARSLAADEPADAMICSNDVVAIGAMRELIEQGRQVPGDVLMMTYHATTAAHLASRPLIVAGPGPGAFAAKALSMLDAAMDGLDPGNDAADAKLTTVGDLGPAGPT